MVPANQQGPIRWAELAHEQLTCQETQDVLTNHTGLLLEMVVYFGVTPLLSPPTPGASLPEEESV